MTSNIDYLRKEISNLKNRLAEYEKLLNEEMQHGPVMELAKLLQVELLGIPLPVTWHWLDKANAIITNLRRESLFSSDQAVMDFMTKLVAQINE